MADTAAKFLIERLTESEVTRIYGYPADGINGITTAATSCRSATRMPPRQWTQGDRGRGPGRLGGGHGGIRAHAEPQLGAERGGAYQGRYAP